METFVLTFNLIKLPAQGIFESTVAPALTYYINIERECAGGSVWSASASSGPVSPASQIT